MIDTEVANLPYGLYVLYWKSGGFSLAAVGGLHDGTHWFAATNWTSPNEGGILSTDWSEVASAELFVKRDTQHSYTIVAKRVVVDQGQAK